MANMDWDLIRSFLAVARSGSLSAAARELDVSQPTLTRDIQNLEKSTHLNLFRRTTQGLSLTEQGETLLEAAERMAQAAQQFDLLATGMELELRGDVRISVNEIVGIYILPAAIKAFRDRHPGVQVEIVISNQASSLNKREADIALRMFRPTQPDLVARRLPDMELGFFAHHLYVERFGEPQTVEDLARHCFIGFDEDNQLIEGAAEMGYSFHSRDFPLRTDYMLAQIALARAGAGIVGTHVRLAEHWPELQRVMRHIPLPGLEYWVVCHRDVQFNARIRAFMQFLSEWYAEDAYRGVVI